MSNTAARWESPRGSYYCTLLKESPGYRVIASMSGMIFSASTSAGSHRPASVHPLQCQEAHEAGPLKGRIKGNGPARGKTSPGPTKGEKEQRTNRQTEQRQTPLYHIMAGVYSRSVLRAYGTVSIHAVPLFKMKNEGDITPGPAHAPTDARWHHVAKPGPYLTTLPPDKEAMFREWVAKHGVPFDPSPQADYDMRGFFSALLNKDPAATQAINPTDGKLHFPDIWKTPYHESFSNESRYALPNAPRWINKTQLADETGKIVFDEQQKAWKERLDSWRTGRIRPGEYPWPGLRR